MTPDSVSLFILAGEPSGDRIGGALVKALKQKTALTLTGVGGDVLAGEGLTPLFPMADLSVMGFSDVVKRLPKLFWRFGQAARAVVAAKPDIVVLVDSQVFSAALAGRLRNHGYRGPILLYVAPAVWAWKPERAPQLKKLFDEVLSVLPFEPAVMRRLNGPPTAYVGHPALGRFSFREAIPERGPLLLLPGSRNGEIERTLPMIRDVAQRLAGHPRIVSFVLPTPKSLHDRMVAATKNWSAEVTVVSDDARRLSAFAEAIAAIAVMGTITLELALAGVPMATTYIGDLGQIKRFLKYEVKFAALPNIVLDRAIVPELLLHEADAARLEETVRRVLDGEGVADAQLAAFAELRALMEKGAPEAPLTDPVERVFAVLAKSQRSMIGV